MAGARAWGGVKRRGLSLGLDRRAREGTMSGKSPSGWSSAPHGGVMVLLTFVWMCHCWLTRGLKHGPQPCEWLPDRKPVWQDQDQREEARRHWVPERTSGKLSSLNSLFQEVVSSSELECPGGSWTGTLQGHHKERRDGISQLWESRRT